MDRICIHKITGKLLEMQSGGDDREDLMEMRLNTLKQNAINAGHAEEDIETRWVDDAELATLMAPTPEEIAAQQERERFILTRAETIATELPSLEQVMVKIDGLDSLIKMRAFLKKFVTVVYMHIVEKVE